MDEGVGLIPGAVGLVEHLRRLGQVGVRLAVTAAVDEVDAIAEVTHRDAQRKAGLLGQPYGSGEPLLGYVEVAQPHRHQPGSVEGHTVGNAADALRGTHHLLAPDTPLLQVATAVPEPQQKDGDPARAQQVAARLQPGPHGGAEVVVVGFGVDHTGHGLGAIEQSPVLDGPLREVGGVGGAPVGQFAGRLQLFQGVVADGQQHVEAWLVVGRFHLAQQATPQERLDAGEHVERPVGVADSFGTV